jgi:hypothetical protein
MLYDPKWGAKPTPKTKPKILSLEGLITWLETQNPATRYSFVSNTGCLLARYFRAKGYWGANVGAGRFFHHRYLFPVTRLYPAEMDRVAHSRNYGDALKLARTIASGG